MERKGRRAGLLALALSLGLSLTIRGTGGTVPAAGRAEVPAPVPLAALTFDDGPRPDTTRRLLEGLAAREVPATFFLIGSQIEGNEDLIREMAAAGHQIGVHTYDHVNIAELSREDFDLQVGRTRALLAGVLGPGDYWLRPPYGLTSPAARSWADGPLILWSVDPEDWKDRDTDRIAAAVAGHTEDGDIILMHDIYESSVDAALRAVDILLDKGFVFVTVEQLMALRGVEPRAGVLYDRLPPAAEAG